MVTCLVEDSDGYLFWYRFLMVTCLVQDSNSDLFGSRF